MKALPFLVQPKRKFEPYRLGNEEIGFLEIERRGYLSVSEKSFVDSVVQGSDGTSALLKLASRVSGRYQVPVEKAYTALLAAVGQGEQSELSRSIQDDFSDEITEALSGLSDTAYKRSIACATILIQSRIDRDWTVEDTLTLDPVLVEEFVTFYDKEDSRDLSPQPEEEQEEPELAEIVGKSKGENGGK